MQVRIFVMNATLAIRLLVGVNRAHRQKK